MGIWTEQTSDYDGYNLNDAYSVWSETMGKFVIVSDGPLGSGGPDIQNLTSPDGASWTSHGNPFSPNDSYGLYGKLVLNDSEPRIMVGTYGGIYTTVDGYTWSYLTSYFDGTAQEPSGIGYSSDLDMWVVFGDGGTDGFKAIYSTNSGLTWNYGSHAIPDLSVGIGHTVGGSWIPSGTTILSVASDVLTLSNTAASTGNFLGSISGGGFAAFNVTTGSPNVTWNPYHFITGAAWSPSLNMFVAVGAGGWPGSPCFWTSSDGIVWTQQISVDFDGGLLYDVIWSTTHSKFFAVGANSGNTYCIAQSSDGINWSTVANDPFPFGEAEGVVDASGILFFTGYNDDSTKSVFSTSDLSTWTDEACPIDGNGFTISYSPSLNLIMMVGVPS